MQSKTTEIEEEGQLKSTFEETLQAIDSRISFIQMNHYSLESELIKVPELNPKSVSDIMISLSHYGLYESPVQPALLDLYTNQYIIEENRVQGTVRCVLPPPSEGEDSVNEEREFKPSFDWVCKAIIDSTMLMVDQMEAKKTERGKVPGDWGGVAELMVFNISKKIYVKDDVKAIEKYLDASFSKFPWVKVKKIRVIYFKGKQSVLIRFTDDYGCSFAYFNLCRSENNRKETLGQNSEIFRVLSNKLKPNENEKWVAILFRHLPLSLSKESFLEILRRKKIEPVWMEELIQIENYKYTLCRVSYLEEVFEICSIFQVNPPIKDVSVNLHPKSSKSWRRSEDIEGMKNGERAGQEGESKVYFKMI